MEIQKQHKLTINMSADDVSYAIISYLYNEQKIAGIFGVKFNLKELSNYDNDNKYMFDGATVVVDLNES